MEFHKVVKSGGIPYEIEFRRQPWVAPKSFENRKLAMLKMGNALGVVDGGLGMPVKRAGKRGFVFF